MASKQAVQFANFFAELRARFSNPDLDLPTIRDVLETMHLATKEPEGVSYAEEDAGGVEALWCIPAGSGPDRVLLHNHMGGTVAASMHSDRKAAAHIAKAAGVRSLVLNYRRSPENKFPAQIDDVDKAYHWLLDKGYQPKNIASFAEDVDNSLIAIDLTKGDLNGRLVGLELGFVVLGFLVFLGRVLLVVVAEEHRSTPPAGRVPKRSASIGRSQQENPALT